MGWKGTGLVESLEQLKPTDKHGLQQQTAGHIQAALPEKRGHPPKESAFDFSLFGSIRLCFGLPCLALAIPL